jgi:hypothetical protein
MSSQIPIINSIDPSYGIISGGIPVTIYGSHLTNTSLVTFGNNNTTPNSVTDTTIFINSIPSNNTSGAVNVFVTNPNGTSTITNKTVFTYLSPPQIQSIDISYGFLNGGTIVTLTGSGFTYATSVSFGSLNSTNFVVISDIKIQAISPPNNTYGLVYITVTTPAGVSNPSIGNSAFIYNAWTSGSNTQISGKVYAIYAAGGFTIQEGFPIIHLSSNIQPLNSYDVTNALQLMFDVKVFNQKLGITKDLNNQYIINTTYDSITHSYPIDTINLNAQEFVNGMSRKQVVSVGTYSTLYSDFNSYVNSYFAYAGGFASLFSSNSDYNIYDGVFDASAFMNIITTHPIDNTGAYVEPVGGSITITNVNGIIRYMVETDIFGNRNPLTGTTASDPNVPHNYGMEDGFMDGDLIMIPSGTTITLQLGIDNLPVINEGPTNVGSNTSDFTSKYGSSYYTEQTTASFTNINRVLTAPLLLILKNFDQNGNPIIKS